VQPVQGRVSEPEHCQPLHTEYRSYCPVHEFDWTECCGCCIARRAELKRIDQALHQYWYYEGYGWAVRGRMR